MKKLFFLLPLLFMSGCAVVAIGAGAAVVGTGASVAADPRSPNTVIDDNKIETKLKLKYADYDNANIYVNSYNGNLLLTGQVANKQMQQDAEFEAKVTPGVKRIYDCLEIRLPQSFAAITTDSYTTTQIKSKIFTINGVNSNNVKVVTTNNVVYLLGIVPKL
jgi:osmotically-inducible protein OsmY